MLLSASESCSKALSRDGTSNVVPRQGSYNQEPGEETEEMVPDGTSCQFFVEQSLSQF